MLARSMTTATVLLRRSYPWLLHGQSDLVVVLDSNDVQAYNVEVRVGRDVAEVGDHNLGYPCTQIGCLGSSTDCF